MLDRDGDGKLSKEEVRYAFLKKRRDITCCQSIVDEHTIMATVNDVDLFDKANVSGDGVLSKREFELYMKQHTKHSALALAELFSLMDDDHDGMMISDEVRMVLLREKQKRKDGSGIKRKEKMGGNCPWQICWGSTKTTCTSSPMTFTA
jgi:Ca2+-binding EF-hand superfamily protein